MARGAIDDASRRLVSVEVLAGEKPVRNMGLKSVRSKALTPQINGTTERFIKTCLEGGPT